MLYVAASCPIVFILILGGLIEVVSQAVDMNFARHAL